MFRSCPASRRQGKEKRLEMPELKLDLNTTLPGESLVRVIFEYAISYRETMSQPMRDAWDERLLQIYDDWRALWVTIGVLK